ncbi:SusC/RagA family TonB-linked outer membrane protein [Haoranjiania flava]|uniref:TonB-dependent receptor n=1 Tax=Haoranjiania flava TaxID=1856322 RepID=A0AAE3LM32_9BACT|nr:TonB-dependent receptor [Haoranjiania flava]MCU7693386.1 TonB-dependent receptor [Haoranjiania flava]
MKKNKNAFSKSLGLLLMCSFCMVLTTAMAQRIRVAGTVTDTRNVPLISANIVIKGTNTGAITNSEGAYTLMAGTSDILVFSYQGMKSQEIAIDGRTTINVQMEEEDASLEDVVVIGYGTVRRKDVTTAVSTVSLKDLEERPITSAAQAIQGKAPGVQVLQPNGQPGAGIVVRVRGNTSITASNDPLYVVDGVPTNDIDFLAPGDIASMQILKDASSAAIYGSRASNGVVLITTKEGKKGAAKVGLNTYVGNSHVIKQLKSLNVSQYKELMDEMGTIHLPDGLMDRTDWFRETFRPGLNQNYQLNLSSGNDKMRYFLSGGYTDEKGVINVAYYKRYNLRANLENNIKSWLKINTNIAYSDYSGNGIITGTGAARAGVILSVINTPTYAPIWDSVHQGQYYNNFYGANITHPVENISRTSDNKSNHNRLLGSVVAEVSLLPSLNFKTSNTIDRVYYHATTFLDPLKTGYGRSEGGRATDSRSLSTILTFDNILTFDKSFGLHSLNLMGGTSYTASTWQNAYMLGSFYRTGYSPKTLDAANKIDPYATGTNASEWALMSYIGRISYNYNSKYLATINLRSDGSSKLSPEHRYGFFPSVSAAWRISAEDFMSEVKWINDMKLRGGWGKTGNQSGIGDYAYLEMYNIQRIAWWLKGNERAVVNISPANMRNRDLTWETTTQSNVGIDMSVLNNKLSFTADAYYKYTTNLLMNVPLPSGLDFGSIYRNEGEMENKGLEFGIRSTNISKNEFVWNTEFNMSFNRNKVTKLSLQKIYYYASTSEATSENVVRMTVGQPLGMFWGYISEGVDPETGDLRFKDLDGNGRITTGDKTYIGNPNPDFTWGMTHTFSYKGLNLNIFFQGSQGNDIYNASRYETEGMYNANNQSTEVLRRWRIPGQITDIPRASTGTDNLRASTRFVEDGSYARLKSLTLSYDIKARILEKWKITRLQPYVTAQNLFTITNYKGFDPEVNQYGGSATVQGIDWGTYPQVKTFIVGVNIDL